MRCWKSLRVNKSLHFKNKKNCSVVLLPSYHHILQRARCISHIQQTHSGQNQTKKEKIKWKCYQMATEAEIHWMEKQKNFDFHYPGPDDIHFSAAKKKLCERPFLVHPFSVWIYSNGKGRKNCNQMKYVHMCNARMCLFLFAHIFSVSFIDIDVDDVRWVVECVTHFCFAFVIYHTYNLYVSMTAKKEGTSCSII